jgi:hypothetical protein
LRSAGVGRRVIVTTTLVLGWVVSWKASPSIAVEVAETLSLNNEIRHQPLLNLRPLDPTRRGGTPWKAPRFRAVRFAEDLLNPEP